MSKYNYNFWKRPENVQPDSFSFDRNDFEDLIENYTLITEIPILLGVTEAELDRFCNQIYKLNYTDAYHALHVKANVCNRKAINMLAKGGNQTALKITSEYFMEMGKVVDNDNSITFVCDVPNVESDKEKL